VFATGAVHTDIFRSIRYLPNPGQAGKKWLWLMVAERRRENSNLDLPSADAYRPSHSLKGLR
jgi:hypothetical protein